GGWLRRSRARSEDVDAKGVRLSRSQFRSGDRAQSDEGWTLVGWKFSGWRSFFRNQHRAGDALEKRSRRRRNRLGGMALPRSDAGVWLRAAVESPVAALFHETDPGRAAERISEVAGVLAAGSLEELDRHLMPQE